MAGADVTTVGDDFPRQQERVRQCLQNGLEIGPVGVFYVAVCKEALKQAELAMASGDITRILAAYQELKDIKE